MKRLATTLATLVAISLGVAACAEPETQTETAKERTTKNVLPNGDTLIDSGDMAQRRPLKSRVDSLNDARVRERYDAAVSEAEDRAARGRSSHIKYDTIVIEGKSTPVLSSLVVTDLYTTYYPHDDFVYERSSSGEGSAVMFIANFGGHRNESAFLHIFHPAFETAGVVAMRQLLLGSEGVSQSRDWKLTKLTSPLFKWAHESYRIDGPGSIVGFACITERNGRGLLITTAYPAEYADGMAPRVDRIIELMRWNDTGGSLDEQVVGVRRLD